MTSLDGIINVMKAAIAAISSLNTTLQTKFPSATGTSSSATGGAATLPANPVGYITTTLPNTTTTVKIPYYT